MKQKETIKEKLIRIRDKIKYPALFILAIIPLLAMIQHYYSLGFPMLNLWDLFVEQLFGSFWLAVIGLVLLFFAILGLLGRTSIYTVTWFNVLFLLAMALGYGLVLIVTIINFSFLIYFIFSWSKVKDMK